LFVAHGSWLSPKPPRGRAFARDAVAPSRGNRFPLLPSACTVEQEQRRSIATRADWPSALTRRPRGGVGAANCRERNTNPLMETATRPRPRLGAYAPRPRNRLRASANWRERNKKENAGQTQPHLQSFFSGSDRPAHGVLYQNRYLNPFQTRFGTINFLATLCCARLISMF
jgi:hypothetical protein